ncbi:uncharacterized protein [Penaeus vannamei]|uniref:uncharacterized protein n=1 Tax=Penaeus vannamei TaxID=6689 RepID=UPI00387FA39E
MECPGRAHDSQVLAVLSCVPRRCQGGDLRFAGLAWQKATCRQEESCHEPVGLVMPVNRRYKTKKTVCAVQRSSDSTMEWMMMNMDRFFAPTIQLGGYVGEDKYVVAPNCRGECRRPAGWGRWLPSLCFVFVHCKYSTKT